MRVVVTGATGNVGTAVVRALSAEPAVDEVVGVARRRPAAGFGAELVTADVARDDLGPVLAGADAVVHLAWLIQPGRRESITHAVNVAGSRRVFAAAVAAGVRTIVYASSVGVYAPGPKGEPVDESWPATGIASSFYSRHKVAVEAELDGLQRAHPALRIVRLRPGLIFQRSAATEIRRLFAGPFLPTSLLRSRLAPLTPDIPGLRVQVVHADDVADAYRRAVCGDARGAVNIAATPPIGVPELAAMLHAPPRPVPARVARAAASTAYALRLSPVEPGWLDLALGVPIMRCDRARDTLGWTPRRDARDVIAELIAGLREGADGPTPPLSAATNGPLRIRELLTGLGSRP